MTRPSDFNFVEWAEFYTGGYLSISNEHMLPAIILPPTQIAQFPNVDIEYLNKDLEWTTHKDQTHIFPHIHQNSDKAIEIAQDEAQRMIVILVRPEDTKDYAVIKYIGGDYG